MRWVFSLRAQPRAPATDKILASQAGQIREPSSRAPLALVQTPGVSGDVDRCFQNVLIGRKEVDKGNQVVVQDKERRTRERIVALMLSFVVIRRSGCRTFV